MSDPFLKKSGDAIQKRRDEIGISQEELALRADLSPSLITKIERSAHNLLKMQSGNLFRLIAALEWPPAEFTEATGVELPIIEKPQHIPVTRSSRYIPTHRLTISKGRGELVLTEIRTNISEDWQGEFHSLILEENEFTRRTVIYQKKGQGTIGRKIITEGGESGVRVGTVIGLVSGTYHLQAIDQNQPNIYLATQEEFVGLVWEDKETIIIKELD